MLPDKFNQFMQAILYIQKSASYYFFFADDARFVGWFGPCLIGRWRVIKILPGALNCKFILIEKALDFENYLNVFFGIYTIASTVLARGKI